MNALKLYLVPAINQQIPKVFANVKGFGLSKLELTNEDIKFVNSVEMNEKVYKMGFWNFVIILAMIALVVFSIFSSFLSH